MTVLFEVDDGGAVVPMRPGYLRYRCRDIGYGEEEGESFGWFTGGRSQGGGFAFQPSPETQPAPVLYLFPDEVIVFGQVEPEYLRGIVR